MIFYKEGNCMKFFSDFERKYQKYAIRNLMYYITILYAVGLIVWMLDPMIYYNYLSLNMGMILHGQIWRLVTFLIYPPAFGSFSFTQIFYGLIALFLYYNLGQTLEYVWGSFRFNVFFSSVLAVIHRIFERFSVPGLLHHQPGCAVLSVFCASGQGKMDGSCGGSRLSV